MRACIPTGSGSPPFDEGCRPLILHVIRGYRVGNLIATILVMLPHVEHAFRDILAKRIRHDVCHGLWPADGFARSIADRIVYVLLILSCFEARGTGKFLDRGRTRVRIRPGR